MENEKEKQTILMSEADERMWAMFSHLSTLLSFVFPIVGMVVGPIIIWQLQKEKSTYVSYHGKESLNFQLTILIIAAVSVFLCLISNSISTLISISFVSIPLIAGWFVLVIMASIKANNGEYYKYPFSFRFF